MICLMARPSSSGTVVLTPGLPLDRDSLSSSCSAALRWRSSVSGPDTGGVKTALFELGPDSAPGGDRRRHGRGGQRRPAADQSRPGTINALGADRRDRQFRRRGLRCRPRCAERRQRALCRRQPDGGARGRRQYGGRFPARRWRRAVHRSTATLSSPAARAFASFDHDGGTLTITSPAPRRRRPARWSTM